MPFLLFTYLATEILAPFFASFIILNGILFLGRLVPLLDIIFDFGIGFTDFIRLCSYIAPKLLLFSIPMASMMGVIIAVTRMINDNEVMALKASGIGLYRMLPPIMIIALCTASLTYFSSTALIPKGTVAMKKLFFQLAKEKIDKGIQQKQFSEGIKNVVLYVDTIDADSNQWQGVYVSDMRHKNTPITIMAKTGKLSARVEDMRITLDLEDGTMNRAIDDLTQTIRFQKYTLNLPLKTPEHIAGDSATEIGKSGLTQTQLIEQAKQHGFKTEKGLTLMIEYHKRIALPVGCFILSLLGLPLAMLARPGRRPMGVPLGLTFFVLYYILFTAGKTFSEAGDLPVLLAMWTPNCIFAAYTFYLIRRVAQESPNLFFEKITDLILGIALRLPWLNKRINT